MPYEERHYRDWMKVDGLHSFRVCEKESDLFILCDRDLRESAREALLSCRRELEWYIGKDGRFSGSLIPLCLHRGAPGIAREMARAGLAWGVGPMAAVAGAIAQRVGKELLKEASEVVVENGGDIFLSRKQKSRIGLFAGEWSPFTGKVFFEVLSCPDGLGVCTSSGTVGHSLSFGGADAVVAIAKEASVADAAATSIGNRVKHKSDVDALIAELGRPDLLSGLIIAIEDKIGFWGDIALVR